MRKDDPQVDKSPVALLKTNTPIKQVLNKNFGRLLQGELVPMNIEGMEGALLVLNQEVAEMAPEGAITYTLSEAIEMLGYDPEDYPKAHELKQAIPCTVLGYREYDARPDLEDTDLWETAIRAANEDLAEALTMIRWGGATLEQGKGTYVIRPGEWDKYEYEAVKKRWLEKHRPEVVALLRHLWNVASSKES